MKPGWYTPAVIAKARRPAGGQANNPLGIFEELEKLRKERDKLKEKVRQLEDEVFELVVLDDHVPGGPKAKKKKDDNGTE